MEKNVDKITHHDLNVIARDLNKIEFIIREQNKPVGYRLIITARGIVYELNTAQGKPRVFKHSKTIIEYIKDVQVKIKKITLEI